MLDRKPLRLPDRETLRLELWYPLRFVELKPLRFVERNPLRLPAENPLRLDLVKPLRLVVEKPLRFALRVVEPFSVRSVRFDPLLERLNELGLRLNPLRFVERRPLELRRVVFPDRVENALPDRTPKLRLEPLRDIDRFPPSRPDREDPRRVTPLRELERNALLERMPLRCPLDRDIDRLRETLDPPRDIRAPPEREDREIDDRPPGARSSKASDASTRIMERPRTAAIKTPSLRGSPCPRCSATIARRDGFTA
ncbi:MAG: hypothetical protein KDA33_07240 [Phycisphaerales bacterium]|nr:hypothetical protein [Phycisphaerales bacterium]